MAVKKKIYLCHAKLLIISAKTWHVQQLQMSLSLFLLFWVRGLLLKEIFMHNSISVVLRGLRSRDIVMQIFYHRLGSRVVKSRETCRRDLFYGGFPLGAKCQTYSILTMQLSRPTFCTKWKYTFIWLTSFKVNGLNLGESWHICGNWSSRLV